MVCKYYCFADIKLKNIVRLSPVDKNKDSDGPNVKLIDIDSELANNLILGRESFSNIKIIKRDSKYEAVSFPKLKEEFKKILSSRLETVPLQEIINRYNNNEQLSIKLIHQKKKKKIKIELKEDFFIDLISEPMTFYITVKNDPSRLIKIITIKHGCMSFDFRYSFSDVSIFTKKIFDNYILETINE